MLLRVITHEQMIADATAKARKLAAELGRDADDLSSSYPDGQQLAIQAQECARRLLAALTESQSSTK